MSNKVSVLLCADNEIVRAGLHKLLAGDGAIAIAGEAESPSAAIERAALLQPDVAVIRLCGSKADTIEFVKLLKLQTPGIHILLIDFDCAQDEVFNLLSAGVYGYCLLNTPVTRLRAAIKAVAEASLWISTDMVVHQVAGRLSYHLSCNGLSSREREVLRLLAEGLTNHQIAEALCLSVETVKTHVRHVMEKMHVSDRTQAAVKAVREGLLVPPSE